MNEIERRARRGEDLRLMCWCWPDDCHGDGIAREIRRRLGQAAGIDEEASASMNVEANGGSDEESDEGMGMSMDTGMDGDDGGCGDSMGSSVGAEDDGDENADGGHDDEESGQAGRPPLPVEAAGPSDGLGAGDAPQPSLDDEMGEDDEEPSSQESSQGSSQGSVSGGKRKRNRHKSDRRSHGVRTALAKAARGAAESGA